MLGELEFPVPRPAIVCARVAERVEPRASALRTSVILGVAFGVLVIAASVWLPALLVFAIVELCMLPLLLRWRRRYVAALHDLIRDGQLCDMIIVERGVLRTVHGATVRCGFERALAAKPGTQLRVLCKPTLPAAIAFDAEQRMYRGSMHWPT